MTEKVLECSWCGEVDPLIDSDKGLTWEVIKFEDGKFHPPCKETYDGYVKVRDAISALAPGEAEGLEDLIREDLRTKIETDAEERRQQ